jgi:hypothetical protein
MSQTGPDHSAHQNRDRACVRRGFPMVESGSVKQISLQSARGFRARYTRPLSYTRTHWAPGCISGAHTFPVSVAETPQPRAPLLLGMKVYGTFPRMYFANNGRPVSQNLWMRPIATVGRIILHTPVLEFRKCAQPQCPAAAHSRAPLVRVHHSKFRGRCLRWVKPITSCVLDVCGMSATPPVPAELMRHNKTSRGATTAQTEF